MKMIDIKIIRNVLVSGIACLSLFSCGDFLEEYSQDTDYVRSWKDLDELLIGDCYWPVNASGNFFSQSNEGMFLHLLADEMEENNAPYSGSSADMDNHERLFGYYTWQQRVGQNENYSGFYPESGLWTLLYKKINVANNILNIAPTLPQNTDVERSGIHKVIGEAHFLRGWYYLMLSNLYGKAYNPATAATDLAVPLKTTQEVNDIKFSRNTIKEAYELIESDLLNAEHHLSQVTTEKKSIYRADVTAARLLLSRFYLYKQDWQQAARYAQLVIDAHPQLQDLRTRKERFMLKSNVENIFSMGGDDVPCMLCYEYQGMRVSQDLYDCYQSQDLRKQMWLWKHSVFQGTSMREESVSYNPMPAVTDPSYFYYMFNDGLRGYTAEVSSLFWLRSAEAYLNLSEAEACQGREKEARDAVNTLRLMRFATPNDITSTGASLLTDIRQERRREMILQGQRWFDLRRYRVCGVYPEKKRLSHRYTYYAGRGSSQMLECHLFVLSEDDPSWTLPIPQEVLDFNTGMENNGNIWREYTVVPVDE